MLFLMMSFENEQDYVSFQKLYKSTVRLFTGVAFNILHNHEDAEDIAYDTYCMFAENYDIYRKKTLSQMKRLGTVVVKNKCLNLIKRRNIMEMPIDYDNVPEELLVDEKTDILKDYLKIERINELKSAILELSDYEKLLIELRYDIGLKCSTIGKQLGLSERKVLNDLGYIKKKLKKKLDGYNS